MTEIAKCRGNICNGIRVYHPTYGYGTIDDCDDDEVYVIFDNHPDDFSCCFYINYLIKCNDVKLFSLKSDN